MSIRYNLFGQIEPANVYLCKPKQGISYALNGIDRNSFSYTTALQDIDSITFNVDRYIDVDGEQIESNGYNDLDYLMEVLIDDIGTFIIDTPPTTNKDTDKEYKEVSAKSCEWEMLSKDLVAFKVNTGEDTSVERLIGGNIDFTGLTIEYVRVYDKNRPQYSLLDIVIKEKLPDWSVGFVSEDIAKKTPYFNIDSTNVYAFFTQDMSKYLQCIFTFDAVNRKINVYSAEEIGEDTGINISDRNLLKQLSIEPQTEEIYTRYKVFGNDELDIRQVNFGSDTIEDITYYLTTKYMPQELIDKYKVYAKYKESRRDDYINKTKEYVSTLEARNELANRLPLDALNYDWDSFNEDELKEELGYFQGLVNVILKNFYANNNVASVRSYINSHKTKNELLKYKNALHLYIHNIDNLVDSYITSTESDTLNELINNIASIATQNDLAKILSGTFTWFEKISYSELEASIYWWDYVSYTTSIIPNIDIALTNINKTDDEKTDYNELWKTNWELYGTNELKAQIELYKNKMETLVDYTKPWNSLSDTQKANYTGEQPYKDLHNDYVEAKKNYEDATAKYNELMVVVNTYNSELESIQSDLSSIANDVSIKNESFGFTDNELKILGSFYIDAEYTNENFLVTEYTTSTEKVDIELELLNYAKEDIAKQSRPQYHFSCDIDNLFAIAEYKIWHDSLSNGNFIWVSLDSFNYEKVRIVSITRNPMLPNDSELEVEFSNMLVWNGQRSDLTSLFDNAMSSTSNEISRGSLSSGSSSVEVSNELIRYILNSRPATETFEQMDLDRVVANEAQFKVIAENIDLTGKVTFSSFDSTTQNILQAAEKTVKSITMHYLATTASSDVTTSTSGWTTTVQQINATKKYLWTYQTINYVDNTTTDTSPVISGVYGNEGKDGEDGTNGVGITSVVPLYYLKSNTTAPSAPTSAVISTAVSSGVWTKSVPTYVANYTYFTCTQTQYTNDNYGWSTVVADNALTNANKTATTANTNATNAVNTANTASTNATNALNRATYHYGTCSTAAGTVAKVVTLEGFSLYAGALVTVLFTNANTASNPTLNVNGTGAKNIRVNNANISDKYYWSANNTVTFVYDGTYWVMSDTSANSILANWCSTNDKTFIDGGKIYTGSITTNQIAIGDFANLAVINPDNYNPNNYTIDTDSSGVNWFKFGSDTTLGYYSIYMNYLPPNITFNKGDKYIFRALVKASMVTSVGFRLRVFYADGGSPTYTNMASTFIDNVPTEQEYIQIQFSVNTLPTAGRPIKNIGIFLETRNTVLGTIYVRDLTVYRMTNNVLIADGAITADKIAANTITADKIDVDDLFSKTITATGTIKGGTIDGTTIKGGSININNKFIVDSNGSVTLPSGTKLSWSDITNQPTILTDSDVTTITENTVRTTNVIAKNLKVEAANIDGELTASQINTTGLIAENISGTTISGKTIEGGKININNKFIVDENGNVVSSGTVNIGNNGLVYNSSGLIVSGVINANGGTFSGNITSTANITGAKLYGAYIESSSGKIADWTINTNSFYKKVINVLVSGNNEEETGVGQDIPFTYTYAMQAPDNTNSASFLYVTRRQQESQSDTPTYAESAPTETIFRVDNKGNIISKRANIGNRTVTNNVTTGSTWDIFSKNISSINYEKKGSYYHLVYMRNPSDDNSYSGVFGLVRNTSSSFSTGNESVFTVNYNGNISTIGTITTGSLKGTGSRVICADANGKLIATSVTSTDLSNYLPLTGGELSGNITIDKSSATTASVGITNTARSGSFRINSDGLLGIWDLTNNHWMLYSTTGGTINIGTTSISNGINIGRASTSTTDTCNVIIDGYQVQLKTNTTISGSLGVSGITGISNTTFNLLTLTRSGTANGAAIAFANSNGTLGSLCMKGAVNTGLFRYQESESAYYQLIDEGITNWTCSGTIKAKKVNPTTTTTSDSATYSVGTSSLRWGYMYTYASNVTTSDRRLKHAIDYALEDTVLENVFDALKPCTYFMLNGSRRHMGFIAQDTEEALNINGLTINDLSFVCKDHEYKLKDITLSDEEDNREYLYDEEGNPQYVYGLKYQELHALEVWQIQKLKTKVKELEEKIALLEAK